MAKDKASQEEIYRTMRQDIENGVFPASSRLPSVRTLAKRFNASPNTISKVVSRLMESGLCTARRGVGLFVRSLPSRKLTLLVASTDAKPGQDHDGYIEIKLAERLAAEGIEIDRLHVTSDDPAYGPAVERVRKPGRVVVTLGCTHEPHLKAVSDLRRPMLAIGHSPNRTGASSIVVNSFRAGYLAARHLIRQGKRSIGYVGRVRRIRQVVLPEAESLKELAGIQAAFMEEGMQLRNEFVFTDMADVPAQIDKLSDMPDGVIMPFSEGVESIQALKTLGNVERIVIGDDRILEKAKRPAAVVHRRDDVIELAAGEIMRLVGDNRHGIRSYTVDCEVVEEGGSLS